MNPAEQPIQRNIEGNATISGFRTTYGMRKDFATQLAELFEKIEELNRPTPMTEGEYLEFANMLKELNKFATDFQQTNPVYIALRASVERPERAKPTATLAKSEDTKNFRFCHKCDQFIAKKGWSKHTKTAKCLTIHNSKKIASALTLTTQPERFKRTTSHPFYKIGQILIADFAKNKALSGDRLTQRLAEWDEFRLPENVVVEPENVVVEPETFKKLKKSKKSKKPNVVLKDDYTKEEEAEQASMGAEDKDAPAPQEKRYVAEGVMSGDFFNDYIKHNLGKTTAKKISEMFAEDEGAFLDYKVTAIENPDDREVLEYTELWFLEFEGKYVPVCVAGINTSSGYSMCRCGMDREWEEEDREWEKEVCWKTNEEILSWFDNEKQKLKIKELLELKRN